MGGQRAPREACHSLPVSAAGRCAALHKAAFAAPWSVSEFESLLADSSVVADGVGGSSTIAGFILSRRAADEAEILTIAIDPAARRRGLATALLGYHISQLARLGVAHLFLEVDQLNAAALALYRRYGFAQVGRRPGYYARPDGTRAMALVLRCDL